MLQSSEPCHASAYSCDLVTPNRHLEALLQASLLKKFGQFLTSSH